MINPLLLEMVRQMLRWFAVLAINLPFMPLWLVSLTSNEEFVLWIAGLIAYGLADTGWLISFWRRAKVAISTHSAWLWRKK